MMERMLLLLLLLDSSVDLRYSVGSLVIPSHEEQYSLPSILMPLDTDSRTEVLDWTKGSRAMVAASCVGVKNSIIMFVSAEV